MLIVLFLLLHFFNDTSNVEKNVCIVIVNSNILVKDFLIILQKNAELSYKALVDIKGLTPVMPAGAMYMMVRYSNMILSLHIEKR